MKISLECDSLDKDEAKVLLEKITAALDELKIEDTYSLSILA